MPSKPSSPELNRSPSLNDVLRVDRHRLSGLRRTLTADQFHQQIAEAIEVKKARDNLQPNLHYHADLPISQHRQLLIEKIKQHPVLVVCGETGSGKSTQLPKLCLEAGLGRDGMIGHTQPRRLAARSIANRLSEEVGGNLGEIVGYKVRFGDQTSRSTLIKLMTDGILLAETQTDKELNQYDAIIIDEAHERSLNIDFLLGYLKKLRLKRPDLKIIITSATIDAERFAEHFSTEENSVPIITVEGRGYPVEIEYLPWTENEDQEERYHLGEHVVRGLEVLSTAGAGDTLVFLPTERDIREVSHHVAGYYRRLGLIQRYELLPLYARLPQGQQQQIFKPDGKKIRIIFATNVAESSLTVPGIRYVIDSGTARISRYNPRLKVQRLPIESISQASANQRAGRCGRLGPGICVRLFSEDDFDSRPAFTTPEIQRANLAAVILQLKTLKLGTIEAFPFLDPPKSNAINDGIRTLRELNAIDDRQDLTLLGRRISRLPVDPRVARILIEAEDNHCLAEVLPIAAALEIQDPRERPVESQQAADEAHASFKDETSDFLSLLKLWMYYGEIRSSKSRSQVEKTLKRQFISPTRMREWADVYRQLKDLITNQRKDRKVKIRFVPDIINDPSDTNQIISESLYLKIHQSLLSGLLSGVAMLGDEKEYTGAGGIKFFIWPGSGIVQSKPKWIVAAEIIETSKTFARITAKIKPEWIESVASHLLNKSYSEPHWSKKQSSAFCYEAKHLFGLPIVLKRRVPLAPIDPATARDLLIEQGLTENLIKSNAKFYQHNRTLLLAIADLASRTRDRNLILDGYQIARLYHDRLPETVIDRVTLEKYDRSLPRPNWSLQKWTSHDVVHYLNNDSDAPDHDSNYFHPLDLITDYKSIREDDFPDEIVVEGSKLPLEYSFAPGSDHDGVRMRVHQSTVSQLRNDQLEWMVPGLFTEKLIQLIKSLPKRLRRNFVPAADSAKSIANSLIDEYGNAPFFPAVCKALSEYAQTQITESDFQREKIDEYLSFIITVVDDDGKQIAEHRDLSILQKEFNEQQGAVELDQFTQIDDEWNRKHVTTFDIDRMPEYVMRQKNGMSIRLFPGWVDHGENVSTDLFNNQQAADQSINRAMTRLYGHAEKKEIKTQVKNFPRLAEATIKLSDRIASRDLERRLMDLLARVAFVSNEQPIRTKIEFDKRLGGAMERLSLGSQEIAKWLAKWIDQHFELRSLLEEKRQWLQTTNHLATIEDQLDWLYHAEFLESTPWNWLIHYPRYLQAISIRISRLTDQKARVEESDAMISNLWHRWISSCPEQNRDPRSQSNCELRWMIEELRVSLFAQSLGTSIKVSPQRCEKLLAQRQ